jgi:hypothetical protein
MPEVNTFLTNVGYIVSEQMPAALGLFMKEPTIYFTAIAFVAAAIGVSRKLIPMKKR